jgi:V8-like Glu-specific endopeptidase
MSNRVLSYAALAVLSCSFAACLAPASDFAADEEDVSADGRAIIGGTKASAYPEAVLVDMYQGGQLYAYCSGSLIAPRVVLTAGHCVNGIQSWKVKAPYASGQTANSTGGAVYDWTTTAETVDPTMHDIGLVFLATPITLSSYPTLATAALASGSKVVNIGRINNGALSTTNLYVSASIGVTSGASAGYPFDYSATDKIESGDSGGPDMKAGTHTIVAVNSGAGSGTEVLARVDLVNAWIQQQIAAHGGSGGSSSSSSSSSSSTGSSSSSSGSGGTCAHALCSTGAKLTSTCDSCAATVCAADSYCCSTKWDAQCVGEVTSFCGQTCP